MDQPIITNDHDLLIAINVQVARIVSDIKEMKDNTTKRVDALESEKLDRVEADRLLVLSNAKNADFESRIRTLERYGAIAVGALYIMEFYLKFFK